MSTDTLIPARLWEAVQQALRTGYTGPIRAVLSDPDPRVNDPRFNGGQRVLGSWEAANLLSAAGDLAPCKPGYGPRVLPYRWEGWEIGAADSICYRGRPVRLQKRLQCLLARLVRARGERVHVDCLLNTLDSSADPRSLKVYISHLNKLLRDALGQLAGEDRPVVSAGRQLGYRLTLR